MTEAYTDFINAFAQASGLDPSEADEQWGWFSRQLSAAEQAEIEGRGEDAGTEMGLDYLRLYPIAERS